MKVLIIDDEEPMRLLCQVNLRAAGIDVVAAPEGLSGIAEALKHEPDVILLDIQMPLRNGLEIADPLRDWIPVGRVPILFLSPRREFCECVNHLALSDVAALAEPFDPLQLSTIVERLDAAADLQVSTTRADLQYLWSLHRVATTPNSLPVDIEVDRWVASLGPGNELRDGRALWAGVIDGRICPLPLAWDRVHSRLTKIAVELRTPSQAPTPLILGAWHYTSNVQKLARWAETLRWARDHAVMAAVDVADDDWHLDERSPPSPD